MNKRHDQARLAHLKQVQAAPVQRNAGLELVRSPAVYASLREGFRLNDWQVHPIDGSLAGPEGAAHLEPKVMEVLVLLASHPGQLVEREILIREIWGKRTVSDEPLTRCIAVLRRALGDSPKRPRCIQTVPKRGYRLVADVAEMSGTVPAGSIAVLPFENMSSDPDNGFFADGIQHDLLRRLANLASLTVVSRTSVLAYRGSPRNMREIGRQLGVAVVVEGGVRRSGDMVRVNADLIDAQTDRHLWVASYDRQLTPENVFAVQNEVATSIAGSLHAALSNGAAAQIGTASDEHDTLMRAMDFGHQCDIARGRRREC